MSGDIMVYTLSAAFERCGAMGIKRTGGVCWLRSPIDRRKEENDELWLASYQSRVWHESQKTSMTEHRLRQTPCLFPCSLVTSRPINTRTRSQHGTTEEVLALPGEMGFLQKEPQDLANRCQEKSGEQAWEGIWTVLIWEGKGNRGLDWGRVC